MIKVKHPWLVASGLLLMAIGAMMMALPVEAQEDPPQRTAQDVCVARWAWNDNDPTDPYWEAPFADRAIGALDLRGRDARTAIGGNPEGWGLFSYEEPMAATAMHCMGGDLDEGITGAQANTLALLLGLQRGNLQSRTMRGVITEMLTQEADPTGVARWKPIQMTRNGASINLPGYGIVYDEPFSVDSPLMDNTLAVRWSDYRRHKARGASMEALQKWNGADGLALFGRDPTPEDLDRLIPTEYRSDGSQRPTTTFTDAFTDVEDTDIEDHTPTSGFTNWESVLDTFFVNATNQVQPDPEAEAEAIVRTVQSLSSADHYAQVDVTVFTGSGRRYAGPIVRFAAAAETFYMLRIHNNNSSWENQVRRTEAGSSTVLFSATNTDYNATEVTAYLSITGSSIDAQVNTVSIISGTDTVITGNLQVGITARQDDSVIDNFEASDGGGEPPAARRIIRVS